MTLKWHWAIWDQRNPHIPYICNYPWVWNVNPLCSIVSGFRVIGYFEVHRVTQKDLEQYEFKCSPCVFCLCPWLPTFLSWVTGHFETRNGPKITLNNTSSNRIICSASTHESQLRIHFGEWFSSYRPFWDNSRMTLNTTWQKVPHMCYTSIPESQISPRFPYD